MNKAAFCVSLLLTFGAIAPPASAELMGGGGSFQARIYSKWMDDYRAETGSVVSYKSISSGGGVKLAKAGVFDFGGTDYPLSKDELDKAGLQQFPSVIGGIVPVVNIPGVQSDALRLDGMLMADIFMGKVTRWSDPRIAAMNPGIIFPDIPVTVVHRDDHSGSTFVISSYLSAVSGEWKSLMGAGTKLRWLTGVKAVGSSELANQVSRIKGAIGYVDFAKAVSKKMAVAQVKNASGAFVKAGTDTFLFASKSVKWTGEDDGLSVNLVNAPGADSWPITTATYVIVKRDVGQDIAHELAQFVSWAFKNGDQNVQNEFFVPLPAEVKKSVEAKLATL